MDDNTQQPVQDPTQDGAGVPTPDVPPADNGGADVPPAGGDQSGGDATPAPSEGGDVPPAQ